MRNKLNVTKINHRLGAFMQKILHSIGEKFLQIIASLLAAAIVACISIMWRLSSTVENHEVRIQSIESRYAQTKDLKNMELIALGAKETVAELKRAVEKFGDKLDRAIEREEDRRK